MQVSTESGQAETGLTPIEELGSFLYFDTNLSEPAALRAISTPRALISATLSCSP